MTVSELYKYGLEQLKVCSGDDASFECDCLTERFTGNNKLGRVLNPDADVSPDDADAFIRAVARRVSGEPLQYILGSWEFYGFEFSVGEGVLIPRPETEMLVDETIGYLSKRKNAVVYDLCAGSGAIGLSVAKLCPDCRVYLFEKYDAALKYLDINRNNLCVDNAVIIKHDITDGFEGGIAQPDLIVSNPPYVRSQEIFSLQSEVLREPKTALDGGEDGLDFYRCICDKWFPLLENSGMLLLECGDTQSREIIKIFDKYNAVSQVIYDFNHVDRAVKIITSE